MIATLLDLIGQLGRTAWTPLWVPVLAWTLLTLPPWILLRSTDRLHPHAEYRFWQVLLAALPAGIGAAALFDGWGTSTVLPGVGGSVVVMPPVETVPESESSPTLAWMHAVGLATVLAVGVGIMRLGRLALDAAAVVRVHTRIAENASRALRAQVDRLSRRLGITRPVRVCETPEATVPVTLGGLRPLLLLPPRLADDADALRMTLLHELIHLRRYDDWAHFAEQVVSAACAAHPLVGRIAGQIAEARERACDTAVLADEQTSAGVYARLLTAFAEGGPDRLGALSLSESPSSLTTRLRAMKSSVSDWLASPFSFVAGALTVGLLVVFGVVACSDRAAPTAPSDSPAPPSGESSTAGAPGASDTVYTEVEEQPSCGGVRALADHIQYPDLAQQAGIEGQVFVQFVVDEDGDVTDPTVKTGVHEALNAAALSAVERLECTPGRQRGEPVKVRMTLPVTFRLDNESQGSSDDTDPSGAPPKTDSGDTLFEKAGIQLVRVLMNEDGNLLVDDEPVDFSNLAAAVRQRITRDAARAALLYAEGAPADRVAEAEATLRTLDVQKVHVQEVK
jgi:TonB family protein